jgi:hypothetical protein
VVVEVFQAAVEVSFPLSFLLTKWKRNVRDPAIPASVAAWKVEEVSRQLCKITRPVTTTDKTCFKISRFNRSYRQFTMEAPHSRHPETEEAHERDLTE